jgi:hypothetical protein
MLFLLLAAGAESISTKGITRFREALPKFLRAVSIAVAKSLHQIWFKCLAFSQGQAIAEFLATSTETITRQACSGQNPPARLMETLNPISAKQPNLHALRQRDIRDECQQQERPILNWQGNQT